MAAWLETAAGFVFPAPEWGSGGITVSTMVKDARNGNGDLRVQVIGSDKLKITQSLPPLRPAEMQAVLGQFDRKRGGRFVNRIRYFDPRLNDWVWGEFYVGDRTMTPYNIDPATMRPRWWGDVKINLVEV